MTTVRGTDTQEILFDRHFAAAFRCARLRVVVAAGLCAVSACAGPFRGARFSEASLTPPDGAAVVHVYHIANYLTVEPATGNSAGNNFWTGLLTERLYIDGKNRGVLNFWAGHGLLYIFIRACEYVSVTLPPGSHEFRADYDPPFRDSSGPIAATATRMDLEGGQTYWVRIYSQAMQTTFWKSLIGSRKLGHTVEVVDRDTGLRDITDCRLSRTP